MSAPDLTVPQPPRGRHLRARDAVLVVIAVAALLILFEGSSIRSAGEEMDRGIARTIVLAVGEPAGWVADLLPFDDAADEALGFLSPDSGLEGTGFDSATPAGPAAGAVGAVTPESFDPAELGADAAPPGELSTVLVTGDSLSMPLDTELARRLADSGDVEVVRDPHVGTGISKSGVVDWAQLSRRQVADEQPDAVVVFIGANEGFPLPLAGEGEAECCGPDWAAAYAERARRMMDTYRRDGAARVYWLTVPTPRDGSRQEITRTVNAALEVASQPFRAHVRVLDTVATFAPDGYRDAIEVDGRKQIVREGDGIHLNALGAEVAADGVLDAIRRDFGS